ncbi:MAG: TetR/AcrR family transcriptional regulator [Solirubrobacterales bacterium]
MASSSGQAARPTHPRGSGSAATRDRLLRAAAELIAEVGWARVTTRAVAERAGLPHGAVSYHFHGKQELLTAAALVTFERAFPVAELRSLDGVTDLLDMVAAMIADPKAFDSILTGVSMEAMRESERDPAVREHVAALLREYRLLIAELVRADQDRGAIPADPSTAGLATMLGAFADGLILHALVDPELDAAEAIESLRAVLVR